MYSSQDDPDQRNLVAVNQAALGPASQLQSLELIGSAALSATGLTLRDDVLPSVVFHNLRKCPRLLRKCEARPGDPVSPIVYILYAVPNN